MIIAKGYVAKYGNEKICMVSIVRYMSDAETATASVESGATAIRQGKYYLVALYGPAKI